MNDKKMKMSEKRRTQSSSIRIINNGMFAFGVDSNGSTYDQKRKMLQRAISERALRRKVENHA